MLIESSQARLLLGELGFSFSEYACTLDEKENNNKKNNICFNLLLSHSTLFTKEVLNKLFSDNTLSLMTPSTNTICMQIHFNLCLRRKKLVKDVKKI